MKLIKPYFEIIEQESGLEGIYKQIELAGRTCYKSEDKITKDSSIEFVQRMINSKHTAMLEHGTVYLKIPSMYAYNGFNDDWIHENYSNNPYSIVNFKNDNYFITTNYRVLIENNWLDDLQYLCEPTEFHTKRISVKFVCDRGVSHEIVRHRKFSFAQESTRYCNYSKKNKFGNEITYIIPSWLDYSIKDGDVYSYNTHIDLWQKSEDANTSNFLQSIAFAEKNYIILISNGWKPQQARAVLPNSLKTEIIVTGFIPDWIHFFRLRSNIAETGAPHPQMEELVTPLMKEFINLGYITEQDVEVIK